MLKVVAEEADSTKLLHNRTYLLLFLDVLACLFVLDESASCLDGGGGVMGISVLRVEREEASRRGEEGAWACYLLVGFLSWRGCLFRFFLIRSVRAVCLTHTRPCISRFHYILYINNKQNRRSEPKKKEKETL